LAENHLIELLLRTDKARLLANPWSAHRPCASDMNTNHARRQRWSTSSSADAVDTSPVDLAALREHLHRCEDQRGLLFGLKCAAEALRGFMAPRMVTTLVVFALLSAIASLTL